MPHAVHPSLAIAGPTVAGVDAGRRAALSALLSAAVLGARPARAAEPVAGLRMPVTTAALDLQFSGYWGDVVDANSKIASARYQFSPNAGMYELKMRVNSALATLSYESSGVLDEAGLHPRTYREVRKLPLRGDREKSVRFEESAQVDGDGALQGDRFIVPRGTQDRVSLLMQISLLARAFPQRFIAGSEVQVHYATLSQVGAATLKVGAVEDVDVGGRTVKAQRLRRINDDAHGAIDFWLGTDAQRAPVVIRFEDDGHTLRFVRREA